MEESAYSSPLEVTGKEVKAVHGRRWEVRAKKSFTAIDLRTGKKVKIKKGAKGSVGNRHKKKPTIIFANGVRIKAKRSRFNYGNLSLSKSYKQYTKEVAEAYINGKGYSSRTKWLVWISQYTGSVHVFKGSKGMWKRQRVAKCIVGIYGRTCVGVFRMLRRTSTHGKPQIYFTWNPAKNWGQSFHCRIDKNTRGAYSSGCIRLGDKDLYYIVNHCPMGTTVVSR